MKMVKKESKGVKKNSNPQRIGRINRRHPALSAITGDVQNSLRGSRKPNPMAAPGEGGEAGQVLGPHRVPGL